MGVDRLKLRYEDIDYAVSADEVRRLDGGDWGAAPTGQARALEALDLGKSIWAKGYNIFVTGAPGTGRRTAVMKSLADYRPERLALYDYVYVYNFRSPLTPKALRLPSGQAPTFKRELHAFVEAVKKLVAMQAESGDFKKRKEEAVGAWEAEENERLSAFEAELAADGFKIVQMQSEDGQTATDILPLRDGEPVSFDELQAKAQGGELSEADFAALRERYFGYMDRMRLLFMELRRGRGSLERRLEALRRDILAPLVKAELEHLEGRYPVAAVHEWLKELERDVMGHVFLFQSERERGPRRGRRPPLARYGVNVLSSAAQEGSPPIVMEANPSYANLFGTIEQSQGAPGAERLAYLKIRAGSILKAAGGFLVIQAEDLLGDEECWHAIKRVLRSGSLEIQAQPGPFGGPGALKPEPIALDFKLVLIGGEQLYDALYQADPDFQKLFKVSAEFDDSMPRDDESLREYVAFCRKVSREEGLRELTPEGIAAAVEYGVRLSEYRDRLSARFSKIADLLREADYRAAKLGGAVIGAREIDEAARMRAWLADLPEEKLADMIVSGQIILRAEGSCVGRVNGLAVHDRGYYAFGLPAVISAQVSPGESGVINIEGESGLSGEIYDKAVLIVEGFLRSRYARDLPLAVSASICFEQSYTAVEGDSASSTAVYALLSALAGVPLRQEIAVTGSVNQMGQIQPVGGVTEKIEGFYRICKMTGLSGSQGVMIPRQNVANLTLSREVMDALRAGSFSIYAVATIDEGIEILTGMDAGAADERGIFRADSFNAKVAESLRRMAETVKEYLN